jgi:hypothetical protein
MEVKSDLIMYVMYDTDYLRMYGILYPMWLKISSVWSSDNVPPDRVTRRST